MNLELLKFLNCCVRIKKDITHQEYTVLGILWASERIILGSEHATISVHHSELDIIPEEEDEENANSF